MIRVSSTMMMLVAGDEVTMVVVIIVAMMLLPRSVVRVALVNDNICDKHDIVVRPQWGRVHLTDYKFEVERWVERSRVESSGRGICDCMRGGQMQAMLRWTRAR